MAQLFPYTYISCPCSDESRRITIPKRSSREIELDVDTQEEDKTLNPRNPRSSFSLFPPEHLLYCEECHDIKCPRCITEEIICWYCPGCLFEVPSSSVKTDENRCSRNCFSCPICTSQLITASLGDKTSGPYILSCNYCMWSSLDVGLQFESANHLRSNLDKIGIGGIRKRSDRAPSGNPDMERVKRNLTKMSHTSQAPSSREMSITEEDESAGDEKEEEAINAAGPTEPNAHFATLKAFYKDQIAATSGGTMGSTLDNFASPSSLARIVNLYTHPGSKPMRTTKPQKTPMREALTGSEGLTLQDDIDKLPQPVPDYIDTVTPDQQSFQYPQSIGSPDARHTSQLWPMSTKLRTKRSKRCAECKHILVKPEFKVTSTRYRIKLIAMNYIPSISLRPVPVPGGLPPPGPDGSPITLKPGKPSQWIMKLTNPLFEHVTVTLASPSLTPGRHGHKVTVLCPQFSIGKNGDVWDDALNSGPSTTLTRTSTNPDGSGGGGGGGGEQQIAGKIYESGRNWTSVVLEVIPSRLVKQQQTSIDMDDEEEEEEDEDVIEIPIRVRLEWTVMDDETERAKLRKNDSNKKKSDVALTDGAGEMDDGKRELAYWMVVGIGRVAA